MYPVEGFRFLYIQKHCQHAVASSKLELDVNREVQDGVLHRRMRTKARHVERQAAVPFQEPGEATLHHPLHLFGGTGNGPVRTRPGLTNTGLRTGTTKAVFQISGTSPVSHTKLSQARSHGLDRTGIF